MAAIAGLATHRGDLIGPQDPIDPADAPGRDGRGFVVAVPRSPAPLPTLDGTRRLVWDGEESEHRARRGEPVAPRFRRAVDAVARGIVGTQFGVALGGGAAWGLAHIGVLEVLEDADLPLDLVTGSSMGALIGALYCAGYRPSQMSSNVAEDVSHQWRYIEWCFWRLHLLRDRAFRALFAARFGASRVEDLAIPLHITAIDLRTGEGVTLTRGLLAEAVRASVALPGLLPPLTLDGRTLVDASITDPVPIHQLRAMGARYTIAINVMQPMESYPLVTRFPYNVVDTLMRCTRISGYQLGEIRSERMADYVLRPKNVRFSMLDFRAHRPIIAAGRAAAEAALPEIRAGYRRFVERVTARLP